MKKLLATLGLAALCQHLQAATPVTTTTVSGHWTLSGSPYMIYNDVVISAGNTLIIDPGVQVLFQGYFTFTANGIIQANGTAAQPITFTIADTTGFANTLVDSGGWKGLQLVRLTSDASVFRYCDISFCKNAIGGGTVPFMLTKDILISNCQFHDIFSTTHLATLYPIGAGMGMDSCSFTNTSAWFRMIDAFSTTNGQVIFTNNTIADNTNDASFSGIGIKLTFNNNNIHHNASASGTVYISYATVGGVEYYSNGEIIGNKLHHNTNDKVGALKCQGGRFYISRNLISNNTHMSGSCGLTDGGGGLTVMGCVTCGTDDSSQFEISSNIIANNYSSFRGGGVYVLDTRALVFNNTIVNNYAAYGGGLMFASNFGSIVIKNNIFRNNKSDSSSLITNTIYAVNYDSLDCTNNWFEKPVSQSVLAVAGWFITDTSTNVIGSNPGMVAPTTTNSFTEDATVADFSLLATSSCVNSGNCASVFCGGADYQGNSRVSGSSVDIGVFEYGAGPYTPTLNISPLATPEILVAPNPAGNYVYLTLTENSGVVTISDMSGKVITEHIVTTKNIQLPLNLLSDGLYLLQWTNNGIKTTARLVVNK